MSKITIEEISDSLKNHLNQQTANVVSEYVEDKFLKKDNTKYSTENGIKEFECKDGYVDNIVIEGETLVNELLPFGSVIIGTEWAINRSFRCLEPNTTYTFFNTYSQPIRVELKQDGNLLVTYILEPNSVKSYETITEFNETYITIWNSDGWTISADNLNIASSYVMAIKGNHTDKSISYFEGLKSVGQGDKIEVLTYPTNNENLITSDVTLYEDYYILWHTGELVSWVDSNEKYYATDYIEVEPNTEYIFANINKNIAYYDANKTFIPMPLSEGYGEKNCTYFYNTSPSNAKYVRLSIKNMYIGKPYMAKGKYICDIKAISTTLRSLPNGVKDTIEKRGNKYVKVQRCRELVLDGNSKVFNISQASSSTKVYRALLDVSLKDNKSASKIFCNRFNSYANWNLDEEECYVSINSNEGNAVCLKILKSRLEDTMTIEKLSAWLNANPVIIVYELATPITIELPNFNPQTYEGDTTLFLNTGAIQGECSFEVTNDLSSEIETLKDKVSGLDADVNKDKITVYSMDLLNGVEATGNNIYGVLQYNDCAVLTAELNVTTELAYGQVIGKLHVTPKRAFYPIPILMINTGTCVEGWLYGDGIIKTLNPIPAGTKICFTVPILL